MSTSPTDFFDRQDNAHRQTGLLTAYFVLAVAAIIATVYLVVMLLFVVSNAKQGGGGGPQGFDPRLLWNPAVLAGVAAATLLIVAGGSMYKIASLSGGGEVVALELGGRLVNPQTSDFNERRLLNIVEEISIASGVPVPPVYILDDEQGINAFAAGFTTGDAVIAVTNGALQYLTRDELQGVLGHEFSHILNGDMRLNIKLMGLLEGILLLSTIGYLLFRIASQVGYSSSRSSNDRDEKKGDPRLLIIAFGLALVVIGWIGVFFGRLIKAAIARQREHLADASSVQFTRNPQGLAGALKKIGGLEQGSKIQNPHAEEASHMFFGDAMTVYASFLSTHPPLEERIRLLDPSFDGTYPEVKPLANQTEEVRAELDDPQHIDPRHAQQNEADDRLRKTILTRFPGFGQAPGESRLPIDPITTIGMIGTAGSEHLDYAKALVGAIPPPLAAAARDPYGAQGLVFCLLLDPDATTRQPQLDQLHNRLAPGLWNATAKLAPLLAQVGAEARLPLVSLAIPALRSLSPAQFESFRLNVDALIAADSRVDLFEFALRRMLIRHLDQAFRMRQRADSPHIDPPAAAKAVGILLSRIAWEGQPGRPEQALLAFTAGRQRLKTIDSVNPINLLPEDQADFKVLDAALDLLAGAAPSLRRQLIDACTACVSADGTVTVAEGELLRAIADALDCPMPPLAVGPPSSANPAGLLHTNTSS